MNRRRKAVRFEGKNRTKVDEVILMEYITEKEMKGKEKRDERSFMRGMAMEVNRVR